MTTTRTSTWIRLALAGSLASAVGIAIGSGGSQAALDFDSDANPLTLEEVTRFQIDGDKVPGLSSNTSVTLAPGVDFDWESQPYGPQPIGSDPAVLAPAGIGSSGLLPLLFENIEAQDFPTVSPSPNPAFGLPGEPEFCVPNNEDAWVGGLKVQDVNIDDPLYQVSGDRATDTGRALDCSQVLGKGDLFSTYAAYENVAIPNVYGDPDSGTQNHTIVYGAWERGEVPGELNFYIPLVDGDTSGNSAGDRLIAFDYDSSDVASFRILAWDGSNWVIETSGNTADSSDIFASAVGNADGSDFDGGNAPSFGEFALDITAAGILPQDTEGGCVELSTGGFVFTETGNSANAQLKDFVGAPKIPIGNCGPLQVTKAGPAGAADVQFDYRIEQLDSEDIFDTVPATTPASTVSQINSQFAIGDTDVYGEVFAEPDYFAFENPLEVGGSSPAPLPEGWEMISITCTYLDAFTRVDNMPVLVEDAVLWTKDGGRTTDVNGDLTTFQVNSRAFNELAGMPDFVPGCTITNSFTGVTVTKAGLGDDTQAFDIDLDGEAIAPALTIGDTSELIAVNGGDEVTVDESTLPAGWVLESIVCSYDDGNGPVEVASSATSPLTFDAVDGQVVNCVVTNNELPTLTLVKIVDNDSGGTAVAADFTLTAAGTGDMLMGPSGSSKQMAIGAYTLSETGPANYTGSAWVCTDGQTGDASVELNYGDDVTCTITNTDDPPSLTLVKEVVNDNGGTATADQWTLVADGYDAGDPQVGTYDLSETGGPDGYTLTSLTCDNADGEVTSVTLGLGEDVTCTFVNDDVAPSLTLVKEVVNDNGGTAAAEDFTLVAAGYDSGNPQAGSYDLSETGPAGYTQTSLTCDNADGQTTSATLAIGEDVTCTFVNDDDPPGLTLVKQVVNDNGGTAVAEDFTLVAAGYDAENPTAGTYALSETGPAGYTQTSLTCDNADGQVTSATLGIGESVTCTFVNDDDAPSLTLVKEVVNDNGGTAVSGDFTLVAAGYDAETPQVGTYDLSETGPAGYTQTSLTCDNADGQVTSATLGLGEDVTCTFVNDDDAPSLTLVKDVVNDDGGNAVAGDFTLVAAGYDAGNPQVGTYALSESGPAGYTQTSLTCDNASGQVTSVTLDLGDDVTCTFVNDDEPVDLQLTKSDGGAETVAGGAPFEYTISVRNIGDRDADLDEPVTVTDELPEPLEWVAFPANCSQAGQILTCDVDPALLPAGGDPVVITASVRAPVGTPTATYVNKASVTTEDDPAGNPPCPAAADNNVDCEPTPVRDADLAIVKTASVDQVGAGGGFTWLLEITNNGPSTAVGVVIGDIVPSSLTVTGVSSDEFDCGFTGNDVECTIDSLAIGEGGDVTITVTVPADVAGGDITNIGTVEAETPDPDLSNNSDDATVTIVAQLPPPPEPPPVTLPRTGSDITQDVLGAALVMLAAGAAIVVIARRRREEQLTST